MVSLHGLHTPIPNQNTPLTPMPWLLQPKVLQIHAKGHLLEPLFRPEIQMLRA